jgi:hypothetical protein
MTVTCSVCGEEIGLGPNGFGLLAHSRMHRRQFRERIGRDPENYEEVAELLPSTISKTRRPMQQTIHEAATDDSQRSLFDHL